ncbi:hypothetical protein J6590_081219 [Homalodisca vitripennis]|nr:hypothetical protein J6590_081219 [Homalodisca vitripennis]
MNTCQRRQVLINHRSVSASTVVISASSLIPVYVTSHALPQPQESEPLRLLDSVYAWDSPVAVMDEGPSTSNRRKKSVKLVGNPRSITHKLRDANDEIANVVASIAEREEINKSMKTGLNELARKLNLIGDFRDQGVELLDKRVVEVFAGYDGICRRAKDELKVIFTARDKELSRQRQLDRLRERNPHNRHQISKAETELIKAKSEVSRNQKALEEQIDLFEKKKLKDIKAALLDFIKIELALHAKAVELYTQAYNSMSEVDEEQDLEELRNAMASDLSRLDTVKRTSFRSSSLQSIANIFTTPQKFQRHEGLPTTSMDELARYTILLPETSTRLSHLPAVLCLHQCVVSQARSLLLETDGSHWVQGLDCEADVETPPT